jgi:hypothetical protein
MTHIFFSAARLGLSASSEGYAMTRKTSAFKSGSFAVRSGNAAADGHAPLTTPGNLRAFDARPKLAANARRIETVRMSHHIDKETSDPFDTADQ